MVIQTHLQWDHAGNTHKCRNAKVVVQKDELEFAFNPNPILAPTYATYLLKGLNYEVVDGYHEIEPGIDLIPSPGHTPGCQSVSVNTEKGRAIIAGFCCVKANFEPPEDMKPFIPVVPCGTHTDPMVSLKSAIQFKEMADIMIPSHDYSLVDVESIP
jgi:glyoxylase-like metal-dependent hydrolase (beta-lactamase superfamily II)